MSDNYNNPVYRTGSDAFMKRGVETAKGGFVGVAAGYLLGIVGGAALLGGGLALMIGTGGFATAAVVVAGGIGAFLGAAVGPIIGGVLGASGGYNSADEQIQTERGQYEMLMAERERSGAQQMQANALQMKMVRDVKMAQMAQEMAMANARGVGNFAYDGKGLCMAANQNEVNNNNNNKAAPAGTHAARVAESQMDQVVDGIA